MIKTLLCPSPPKFSRKALTPIVAVLVHRPPKNYLGLNQVMKG